MIVLVDNEFNSATSYSHHASAAREIHPCKRRGRETAATSCSSRRRRRPRHRPELRSANHNNTIQLIMLSSKSSSSSLSRWLWHRQRPLLLLAVAAACLCGLLGQAGLHRLQQFALLRDAQQHAAARTTLLLPSDRKQHPHPPPPPPNKGSNSRNTTTAGSPFLFYSHPPQAGALDADNNPRHACLAQIRQRHGDLLGPLLLDNSNEQSSSSEFLLVDPAYHANVGDHMITVAEVQFLTTAPRRRRRRQSQQSQQQQSQQQSLVLHQCSYVQAGDHAPRCESEITRLSPNNSNNNNTNTTARWAVWHGGGNWGDLWRRAHEPRLDSFEPLLRHGYRILALPNSWHYRDAALEARDVARMRRSVAAGLGLEEDADDGGAALQRAARNAVVLTWRERSSRDRAAKVLPWATNLLVPDLAFQLGPYNRADRTSSVVDVLFLLRDDHESLYAHQRNRRAVRQILETVPGGSRLTFSIVDWKDRAERFGSSDPLFTDAAIRLLALGRVVVCDRLHAAILAFLSGLPFVYLDQVSGKISATFAVAMDSDACRPREAQQWAAATDLSDAVRRAVEFLDRYPLRAAATSQDRHRLRRRERRETVRLQHQQQ